MTLISVLVTVAVMGIGSVIMAALFQNMGGMMSKMTTSHDAETMLRSLRAVFANRDLCTRALATALPGGWADDTNEKQITSLQALPQGGGAGFTVAQLNQRLGGEFGAYIISNIRLLPYLTDAEGNRLPSSIPSRYNVQSTTPGELPVAFKAIPSTVRIDFQSTQAQELQQGLRPRYVNVTVGVNQSNFQIEDCPVLSDMQMPEYHCNATSIVLTPDGAALQSACEAAQATIPAQSAAVFLPALSCHIRHFVRGFNDLGTPICVCATICN